MASLCSPGFTLPRGEPLLHVLNCTSSRFLSPNLSKSMFQPGILLPRVSDSGFCCRCDVGSGGDSVSGSQGSGRYEFGIQETFRGVVKRIEDYLTSFNNREVERSVSVPMEVEKEEEEEEEEEWGWDRWMKHFVEIDEQERIIAILKSELAGSIVNEDYEDAARLKVAIAAAATHDTVGRVVSHMKKLVDEEQYGDAALIRDFACAGLVGWWAGVSDNLDDPYGRIIHISAERGRYIAKSYSPRQLETAKSGSPLFEVYLRETKNGAYQQQAVYLKRKEAFRDLHGTSFQPFGGSKNPDSHDVKGGTSTLLGRSSDDTEDSEDRGDDLGIDNILHDMIPGMKVKVVRVTVPEKADQDIISKVIEQIIHEEEDETDGDFDIVESEDESKNEANDEYSDIELDSSTGITEENEKNQISFKFALDDVFLHRTPDHKHADELLRVPARLEKKDRMSFTFNVDKDASENISSDDLQSPKGKTFNKQKQRSIDFVLLDLVKAIGKGKVPMKVLKDVSELVNLTLSQARNQQPLAGTTTFHRISVSSSSDPLNGLYVGAHGLHTSEVILMKRRFGQWKEDKSTKKPSKLEFYEYVEAVKVTGDAYVPAGQVAFRAKVGKHYQLPHKGIIPEEFGVIARYRGQGRLAEPGFNNPRWVDGELVILDGKYIKEGPVVGFIYSAPEYHFLAFFNRLLLVD